MKSNIPLIIFALFFVATFVAFIVFKRREESDETPNDSGSNPDESTEE